MSQTDTTTARRDWGDIAFTLGTSVVNMAIGVVTGVLTARGLEPSDRGSLLVLTLWLGFVSAFSLTALDDALIVTSRGDGVRGRGVRAALRRTTTLQSVLAMAILALVVGTVSVRNGEGLAAAALTVLIVPMTNLARMALAVLRTEQRFRTWNVIRLLPQLVYGLGIIALVATHSLTVFSGIASLVVANVVTTTASLLCARGRTTPPTANDVQAARRLGLRLFSGYVPAQINLRLDQLILGAAFAPHLLGVYAVAVSIANVLQTIGLSLEEILFPKLATRSGAERLMGVLLATVAFAAVAALASWVWGDALIGMVYGADYVKAAPPLTVLAFGACFLVTTSILTALAKADEQAFAITAAQVTGVVTTLVLLPILAHRYGILGAAWASTTSYAVTAVMMIGHRLIDTRRRNT